MIGLRQDAQAALFCVSSHKEQVPLGHPLRSIDRFADPTGSHGTVKWSQSTGERAKVYPETLKGYENGEAKEVYRPV